MDCSPKRLGKVAGLLVGALTLIMAVTANAAYYNLTQITYGPNYCSMPKINDFGQIVWVSSDEWVSDEIYLYKDGKIIKITDNNYTDNNPEINNNGHITWYGQPGWWDYGVFVYDNVATKRIFSSGPYDYLPQINDKGQIVWIGQLLESEIFFYNNGQTYQLTNDGSYKSEAKINSRGQIVWEQSYLGGKDIYFYNNWTVINITNNVGYNSDPQINDHGQIIWTGFDGTNYHLYLFENGVIKRTTDNANNYRYKSPKINNSGEIAWIEDDGIWLYRDGAKFFLNDYCGEGTRMDVQLNDFGQVAWYASGAYSSQNGVYFYSDGKVTKIVSGIVYDVQLNNAGQVVMDAWDGNAYQIYLSTPKQLEINPNPPVAGDVGAVQDQVAATYITNNCVLITPQNLWGDSYNFNPDKPTVILVEGWDILSMVNVFDKWTPADDYLWDWQGNCVKTGNDYYNMALMLKDKANVFIWDWTALSSSPFPIGPPVKNAPYSSIYLAKELSEYFADPDNVKVADYNQPIQFIGHSMGGEVSLRAAMYMDGLYENYSSTGDFEVEQVTLLDPYNCADLTRFLDNNPNFDFYIDHYASLISRLYFGINLYNWRTGNCFVSEADVNLYLADVDVDNLFDIPNAHHEAVDYYMDTITNPDKHYGYYWSVVNQARQTPAHQYYFGDTNQDDISATDYQTYVAKAIYDEIRDLKNAIDSSGWVDNFISDYINPIDWTASAASTIIDWAHNGWVKLTTGSPSYVYQSVALPDNAEFLDFQYEVVSADDNAYVALMINDDLLYYLPANASVGEEIDSGLINISKYAGQTVDLIFLVDDPDSAGGATAYLGDVEILEGFSYNPYDFTFTYGNGDYYTGTVYATSDKGYYPGYTQTLTDENGLSGTYEITMILPGTADYAEKLGQVFVSSYYDSESGQTFTPLGSDNALGTDYLGTEQGYIIMAQQPAYLFGASVGTFYEADLVVGNKYTFTYHYGNGDSYTGTVYAAPSTYRYYLGYTESKTDENGQAGYYEIAKVESGKFKPTVGQVFVDRYFDVESGKSYDPMGKTKALGTKYLGSEVGYICQANIPHLKFGQGYYEADVAARFNFAFYYGNGDYYLGTVYATTADYSVGYKKTKTDENGQPGYYEILTGVTYLGYSKILGQVMVDKYYDAESQKTYASTTKTKAAGTKYLGSEVSYILTANIPYLKFGQGYWEADVAARYNFAFYYGNGDYYLGTVYATTDKYSVGDKQSQTNETGQPGYYEILPGVTYLGYSKILGQVMVSKYFDQGTAYQPVSKGTKAVGTKYLGSEMDYIIKSGVEKYRFGLYRSVFYEANAQ